MNTSHLAYLLCALYYDKDLKILEREQILEVIDYYLGYTRTY